MAKALLIGIACVAGWLHDVPAKPEVKITAEFPGGNVVVERNGGDTVEIAPDLRGGRPWFYWYFEAEVVRPGRVTFVLADPPKLSARGPAISLDDGRTWRWLGAEHVVFAPPRRKSDPQRRVDTFTYDFSKRGQKVRFAVTIPYLQRDLDSFLEEHSANRNLKAGVLTRTLKGKPVELLQVGTPAPGRKAVLATCRHHACETMASFVLEGFLGEAMSESAGGREFRRKYVLYAVPMVDKDGVQAGDQGKNRRPHDHNRDYKQNGIYPETAAIRKLAEAKQVELVMDFHDPLIRGESHTVFAFYGPKVPHNYANTLELARWMEEEGPPVISTTRAWLKPPKEPDPMVGVACSSYFARQDGILLSVTLETPYTPPHLEFDAEMARAYGAGTLRAWARTEFITAAPESVRHSGGLTQLEEFRKSFHAIYRGKPEEAEALAITYLSDPGAPSTYRAEANNLMGELRLRQKRHQEAWKFFQAALDDPGATVHQRATALAKRVVLACRRSGASAVHLKKTLSAFERYSYPSARNRYEVYGHVQSFHAERRDAAKALAYGRQRLAAASRYDKGRVLIDLATLQDQLRKPDDAVATREQAVAHLREQLDPVPVGIMGPMMALDLLEALNGIPNATTADKRAAAKIGLEHEICSDSLRRRIRDAMPRSGQ